MKKSIKPLSLKKLTISNLSSAEMSEKLGGRKPKKTDVLTCQRSCDPTIRFTYFCDIKF